MEGWRVILPWNLKRQQKQAQIWLPQLPTTTIWFGGHLAVSVCYWTICVVHTSFTDGILSISLQQVWPWQRPRRLNRISLTGDSVQAGSTMATRSQQIRLPFRSSYWSAFKVQLLYIKTVYGGQIMLRHVDVLSLATHAINDLRKDDSPVWYWGGITPPFHQASPPTTASSTCAYRDTEHGCKFN